MTEIAFAPQTAPPGTCDPRAQVTSWQNWRTARDAGNLTPGCVAIANNVDWILAGGVGEFSAIPTDTNRLPEDGWYESPVLNPGQPWPARMDWDNGQVYWMYDSTRYQNEVRGATPVRNFPWGNSSLQGNIINRATLAYTGGTFNNNQLGPQSNITVDGGTVSRLVLDGDATATVTGGTINESEIKGASIIFVDAANVQQATLNQEAYVDLRGFSGNFHRCDVQRARVYVSGTGRIEDCYWQGIGYLYARNVTNLLYRYMVFNGYGYAMLDDSVNFRIEHGSLSDVAYLYARRSQDVSIIRLTGVNQGRFVLDDANGLILQYAIASNNGLINASAGASGRLRYVTSENGSNLDARNFSGQWDNVQVKNASTLNLRDVTGTGSRRVVLNNQAYLNAQGSASRFRRCLFEQNYWDDRNGGNLIEDCHFTNGAQYTRNGAGEYFDCGGVAYPYLYGVGSPQGRATRVRLSGGRLYTHQAAAGWSVVDSAIDSAGQLRIESEGGVTRSTVLSVGVLRTRHTTGNVDRAFVMQAWSTLTAAVTNHRYHGGGAF